jgi:hypothetical protein
MPWALGVYAATSREPFPNTRTGGLSAEKTSGGLMGSKVLAHESEGPRRKHFTTTNRLAAWAPEKLLLTVLRR